MEIRILQAMLWGLLTQQYVYGAFYSPALQQGEKEGDSLLYIIYVHPLIRGMHPLHFTPVHLGWSEAVYIFTHPLVFACIGCPEHQIGSYDALGEDFRYGCLEQVECLP